MNEQLQRIGQAAAGLLYLSEGDHPFEVVATPDRQAFLQEQLKGGANGERTMEVVSLEHFFCNSVKVHYDAPAVQQEVAKRFRQLIKVLQEELTDIAVYRIGTIEIDAFIIGQLEDCSYGGLKTKVIET